MATGEVTEDRRGSGRAPAARSPLWRDIQDDLTSLAAVRAAKAELKCYGFRQGLGARLVPALMLIIAGALVLLYLFPLVAAPSFIQGNVDTAKIATAILAIAGLVSGFQQWRAARRETSLDKYYERLKLANERLNEWPCARALLANQILDDEAQESPRAKADHERHMYMHVELDNLEYAIQKYQIGYMAPEVALRALRTFRNRCGYSVFRDLVNTRLSDPRSDDYTDLTKQVVAAVMRDFGVEVEYPRGGRAA